GKVSPEMIKQAEWIAGLELSDKEREGAARAVQRNLDSFRALREVEVGYDVPPALAFVPAPSIRPAGGVRRDQATTIYPHAARRGSRRPGRSWWPSSRSAPWRRAIAGSAA